MSVEKNNHSLPSFVEAYSALLRALSVVMILATVGYCLSGFRVVRQDERAVVYTFGKAASESQGPGIVPGLPHPLGKTVVYKSTTLNNLELDDWKTRPSASLRLHPLRDGYTLTGDVNIVQGRFILRYRVTSPHLWHRTGEAARTILKNLSMSVITREISSARIDELLGENRSEFAQTVLQKIRSGTEALELGIAVDAFDVVELLPPPAVKAAFDSVTTAQVEAATLIDEARSEANRIESTSRADAAVRIKLAQADAERLVQNARGWSARFDSLSAQAKVQPEVFARQYWSDTISRVLQNGRLETVLPPTGQGMRIFWKPGKSQDDE